MHRPAFQGLVMPKIIYSVQSEINGQIDVVDIGNTRKIKVEGLYQSLNWDSPSAKRLVWGKATDLICEQEPKLKNILILGLGGATVQHQLFRRIPEIEIVSVDIDPAMVDIAKNYFDLESIPNHKVIVADACRVIIEPKVYELEKGMFGTVLVDIYVGSKYPDLGKSGNFVAAVKSMITSGGLVVFNRMYTEEHQDEVNSFIDFIEGFFKNVETKVVAGYTNSDNILIYGRV